MMNGRLDGRPFSARWPVTSLVLSAWPRPITMAPRYVSGRLVSRPMTAAPNTWMASSVSSTASTPSNGASSTPARAANEHPSIQLKVVMSPESSPSSSVRPGSSTTARVWIPSREKRKNTARPAPASAAMATRITWSQPTFTPGSRNVLWGKIGARVRVAGP